MKKMFSLLLLGLLGLAVSAQGATLSLSVTTSPAAATVNAPITYSISVFAVRTDFSAGVSDVVLNYAVPGSFTLQSASSSAGSCSGTQLLECRLGTLEGTLANVVITLVPTQEGSVSSAVTVTGLTLGAGGAASITSANMPLNTSVKPPPAVNLKFSAAEYRVAESAAVATITVLRSDVDKNQARAVSVEYFTKPGSALAGDDYVETTGSLVWAEGDTNPKTFSVVIQNDTLSEDDEVLGVGLRNAQDASIEGDATVKVIITDDEMPGTIGFSAAEFRGGEKDGRITVSVLRSGGSDGAVTVNYTTTDGTALAGEDYTPVSGVLSWENGDLSPRTFTVQVMDDGVIEGHEFFRVLLSGAGNRAQLAQAGAEVRVLDNISSNEAVAVLSGVARNPVQAEMARVIGTLCQSGHAGADLQARCTELVVAAATNPAGVADALQQWAPEEYAALGRIGVEAGSRQVNNIFTRLQALRTGAVGVNLKDLAVTLEGETVPLPSDAEFQLEGKPLPGSVAGELPSGAAHAFELYDFGLFLNGHVGISERDQTDGEAGFKFARVGITGGIDYRFSDRFILGAALGYSLGSADLEQERGSIDNDLLTLGLYGTFYEPKRYFVDFIYSYGFGNYEVARNIQYLAGAAAVKQTAQGGPDSAQKLFGLSGGWHFQRDLFSFTPTLRLENIDLDIDSVSETMSAADQAGSGLSVSLDKQRVKSTTFALGLQMAAELQHSSGKTLIPQLNLEWIQETQNKQRELRGRFRADGGREDFALFSDAPDTQYFSLGLGLGLHFGKGKSAFVNYETLFGLDYTSNQSLLGGMRWEF